MIFHLPLKQKPNGHYGFLLNEMKLSHEHTIQKNLANVKFACIFGDCYIFKVVGSEYLLHLPSFTKVAQNLVCGQCTSCVNKHIQA